MPEANTESAKGPMRVRMIGGRIGAIVEGIQLSARMSTDEVGALRQAVLRHKVVFARDQRGTTADWEEFAERLGEPVPYTYFDKPPEGTRYSWEVEDIRADHWHFDLAWHQSFPGIGILTPVELSEFGGETAWANTAAAYQELPPSLKAMADQLWAVHSPQKPIALSFPNPSEEELATERKYRAGNLAMRHPVVRVHPETGERILLLGNTVFYLEGFARTPGNNIYEMLQYYITRPENTIRWHWQMGDVAIWDNRATQHYGVRDYQGCRRVLRRISLKGSIPQALDGTLSSPLP